jgi:hypothetical protein
MLPSLKGEKLMDRHHCRRVATLDSHLPAARKLVECIANPGALRGHDRGARNWLMVDHHGSGEITRAESGDDCLEVTPDLFYAGRVLDLVKKHDAAAIRPELEGMGRGILVDSHGGPAPLLHRAERTISMRAWVGGILRGRHATADAQHDHRRAKDS